MKSEVAGQLQQKKTNVNVARVAAVVKENDQVGYRMIGQMGYLKPSCNEFYMMI